MQLTPRFDRLMAVAAIAFALSACSGQKQPAEVQIGEIEATVMAAAPEAAKYVPQQLHDVQNKLGELKGSFAEQNYAAVLNGAPSVLAAAQALATAAAAKKDQVLKALNDRWTDLAAVVPGYVTAIRDHIDLLSKKSSKKIAAGLDLDAARAGIADAATLWSKAQAGFAAGNMEEAVRTAEAVRVKALAVAAALKFNLAAAPAFAARTPGSK